MAKVISVRSHHIAGRALNVSADTDERSSMRPCTANEFGFNRYELSADRHPHGIRANGGPVVPPPRPARAQTGTLSATAIAPSRSRADSRRYVNGPFVQIRVLPASRRVSLCTLPRSSW
jgi:hypothetical protein